jgi:hypothetical protein
MLNHRLLEMSGFSSGFLRDDRVSTSSIYIVEVVEMPTACRSEPLPL